MKKFIPFLFLLVSGCTVKVPDYRSAETGEGSPWIDVYGDTMKDLSVYITYSDGKIVASVSGYCHPDSVRFLQDVNVSISEFGDQDAPLLVCYGTFPGVTNEYLEAYSFRDVADSLAAGCDSLEGDRIDFQITRTYSVAEDKLPETLQLNYDVKTMFGNKTGAHSFRRYEKEVQETIRIH